MFVLMYLCACECLRVMQVLRSYCSGGLRGPPTAALSPKSSRWKKKDKDRRRGEISPQERLPRFSNSSMFLPTIKPEHFNKRSTLRSTSNVKAKGRLPFNCLRSWEILMSVHVCVCANAFLPEYLRRPGQFTSTRRFPQRFPSRNGQIIADRLQVLPEKTAHKLTPWHTHTHKFWTGLIVCYQLRPLEKLIKLRLAGNNR